MKRQRRSIFNAFATLEVFVGILCVFMFVSFAEAGGKQGDHHPLKYGKHFYPHKLNYSVKGLKECSLNLDQAMTDLDTCSTYLGEVQADLEVCNTGLDQAMTDLGITNTALSQAQADLGACKAALSACGTGQGSSSGTATVAKTGQSTSYAAGDDGDLQEGLASTTPRFIDNWDGTVTDNLTGLVWMQDAGGIGAKSWADAVQICNTLAHGSYGITDGSYAGDWRLPNIRELYSLVDFGHYNYALPDGHLFINLMNNYWSSTTYAGNPNNALYLNAMTGLMSSANKVGANVYVLCVRDAL
jgi:hypothetical protein